MSSFRDRFLTPRVARSMTSPSAILATGAGAAVAIALALNPIVVVVAGAAAYSARVLAAVPRKPAVRRVDPSDLSEPWKSLFEEVIDAGNRFDNALKTLETGPLRERLTQLGESLRLAMAEAGRVATAGQQLSTGRQQIDTEHIQGELRSARSSGRTARTDRTIEALEAQLASAQRLDATIADTYDRLRLLDARIDEMVTRTVELSVTQVDVDDLGGLGNEVDSIVSDMEALRQAVEETRTSSPLTGSNILDPAEPPTYLPPGQGPG